MENFTHVESKLNPADIGTRMGVKLADLGPSSMWQRGPSFLLLPRERWPVSSLVTGQTPREELRKHRLDAWRNLEAVSQCRSKAEEEVSPPLLPEKEGAVEGLAAAAQGRKPVAAGPEVPRASIWKGANRAGRQEASLLEMARESLLNATSWITAQGALARRLRAGGSDREKIRIEPTPREREAAKKLQLLASSASAREALEKGKLLSLGAQINGREGQGTVVVDGRLKKAELARLLGIQELVVIMPTEQLALLVMTDAHREDHRRSVQDITARARRHIWIPRGGPLARAVVKDCALCRRNNAKMARQIMSKLPEERTQTTRPFQFVALDFFGPFKVKDLAGGRRRLKCWGIIYSCLATRAVAIYCCPGYSTKDFLATHGKFTATYGDPSKCYADHGTQIVAGAKELDWTKVTGQGGAKRTEWVFTARGCSWRNGAAEVMIRSARRTLGHVLERNGQDLDFHQADAALRRVGDILNHRPLTIRASTEEEFYAITPADLLLGRATDQPEDRKRPDFREQDEEISRMLPTQEQVAREWWLEWTRSCFASLVPRTKWKKEERNARIGDIALLKYSSKFAAPSFRLCRVSGVKEDGEGVVRTCEVTLRPQRQGESGLATYKYKKPSPFEVGVQRLAIILPVEEQGQGVLESVEKHQTPELGSGNLQEEDTVEENMEEGPEEEQAMLDGPEEEKGVVDLGNSRGHGGALETGHLQESGQGSAGREPADQGVNQRQEQGVKAVTRGVREPVPRKVKNIVKYSK